MSEFEPKVGQVYRDTYGDNYRNNGVMNPRTIRITQVLPNRVWAEILTGTDSKPPLTPRRTVMQIKTLRAGYELVGDAA